MSRGFANLSIPIVCFDMRSECFTSFCIRNQRRRIMCGKLSYLICVVVALGMIAAPHAGAADPTLIGWWKFEEASGTLQDESDYNNDGTGRSEEHTSEL